MVKANKYNVQEILDTEKVERSEADNFYLRLYMTNNVPFF